MQTKVDPSKNEKITKKALEVNVLYKKVFGDHDGQEVLKDLIASCGLMEAGSDITPQGLAFKEGCRSVVLKIIQAIQLDPGTYIKLLEQIRDEQEEIFK